MKTASRAISAINEAILAIDNALTEPNRPSSGPMSIDQLRRFRIQLVAMLDDVCNSAFVGWEISARRFGPIIADSWPLESKLGETILEAENEYLKYMKSRK